MGCANSDNICCIFSEINDFLWKITSWLHSSFESENFKQTDLIVLLFSCFCQNVPFEAGAEEEVSFRAFAPLQNIQVIKEEEDI